MSVEERLASVFRSVLEFSGPIDKEALKYNSFANWNSLGHMTLVAAIETEFDCILDTDDILAMSDFDKALEIVGKYVSD